MSELLLRVRKPIVNRYQKKNRTITYRSSYQLREGNGASHRMTTCVRNGRENVPGDDSLRYPALNPHYH